MKSYGALRQCLDRTLAPDQRDSHQEARSIQMKAHSQTTQDTQLLIIGAGPFGLSLAAYAAQHGIDYTLVGRPMEFWHKHMPRGMYLRSACDWHLDPDNRSTIERFLELRGQTPSDVEP